MACESCKIFIKEALEELDIATIKKNLGEIEVKEKQTTAKKKKLNSKIQKAGLELLEKKQRILIEKIRIVIIDYVYNSDKKLVIKFSVLLSEKLNHGNRIDTYSF